MERCYFHCGQCKQGEFRADGLLGINGYVSSGARRMAVLLGVQTSFAKAERTLREVAGWELDDNTLRQLCHATANAVAESRQERATAAVFSQAEADAEPTRPVDTELHIDAGKVNTLEGWRDVKVAVFCQRERDESTTAMAWDGRDLPPPLARSVMAAVEQSSEFGPHCHAEAQRLGLTDAAKMTILGDGAEWLWNIADRYFAGADQVLDFWHGTSYLDAGAKGVFGSGDAALAAFEAGKSRLLEDGYFGVTDWVGGLTGRIPAGGDGAALGDALNYFCGQQGRLNYALRLRRGQSIGSGLVEGTIKQIINKRLKQTGARWKVGHVPPFVELVALAEGPEWEAIWEN
jgi:hypothetical protein